jgi:hypothetical protein
MSKTGIHLFASLHLCVFALNFQLTFGINGVASNPAGEADPACLVTFYKLLSLYPAYLVLFPIEVLTA